MMCEWTYVYQQHAMQGMYGNPNLNAHGIIQPGRCPVCRKVLSMAEMRPKGRCTRSMCNTCFERRFKRINDKCQVCGGDIRYKTPLQQRNWREIKNHLCDDPNCAAAWALQHAIVLGVAQSAPALPAPQNLGHGQTQIPQLPQSVPVGQLDDPDVIDAVYSEVTPDADLLALTGNMPMPKSRQLPAPEPRMTVPDFLSQDRKADAVVVDLRRKRR